VRVSDLAGWIPEPGSPFKRGDRVPRPDEVFIENVLAPIGEHLAFSCKFEGRSIIYDFPMLDEKTRPKIVEILHENIGKTLLSIGKIQIPSD